MPAVNRRDFFKWLGLAAAVPGQITGKIIAAPNSEPSRVVYKTVDPSYFELIPIEELRHDIYGSPVGRIIFGYRFKCLFPSPVAVGTEIQMSAMGRSFRGYADSVSRQSKSGFYEIEGPIQNPID